MPNTNPLAAALAAQAERVVLDAIDSPAVPLSSSLATVAARRIAARIEEKAAPLLQHATNSEPWYRSRVTWGALVSILLPLAAALGVATDAIDPDEIVSVGVAFGTAFGGVLTLYGRWVAIRPVGA